MENYFAGEDNNHGQLGDGTNTDTKNTPVTYRR